MEALENPKERAAFPDSDERNGGVGERPPGKMAKVLSLRFKVNNIPASANTLLLLLVLWLLAV